MALTSTEQLFIERPLYRRFLHNDHLPISSNFCKKKSLQCYWLYNFPSFRSSHWRCSVRKGVLRNSAKFTGKHLWQSLFFNKVAGWSDCFWYIACLLLKTSRLFHFNRKIKWKKGNTLMKLKYLLFCRSINLFDVKDFKRSLEEMVIWSENVFKGNLMLQFFMIREISLGKGFWVWNTWRALVQKRLKRLTLNFETLKTCPVFPNNELFIFYWNNWTSFESVFCIKTVESRLFKKYLESRKLRARFSLSLGWLHVSEKSYWKLQFCRCRSSECRKSS